MVLHLYLPGQSLTERSRVMGTMNNFTNDRLPAALSNARPSATLCASFNSCTFIGQRTTDSRGVHETACRFIRLRWAVFVTRIDMTLEDEYCLRDLSMQLAVEKDPNMVKLLAEGDWTLLTLPHESQLVNERSQIGSQERTAQQTRRENRKTA
jgi:hypothetical protein